LIVGIEVWKKVVEEINRNRADPSHSIRNHLPEDYYLGFGCPTVKKYIEQLPNARKCKFYRSQNDLIIRIPRAVVTEVLGNIIRLLFSFKRHVQFFEHNSHFL